MKICSRCKQTKVLTDFYADKRSRDGRMSHCKQCERAYKQRPEVVSRMRQHRRKNAQTERAKRLKRIRHRRYADESRYKEYHRQYKQEYWKRPEAKERQRKYRQRPDVRQRDSANRAVLRAIKRGLTPHATKRKCADCGNQASQHHHHNGYEPKHWLDVVPICRSCHGKRHRKST